MRVKQITAQEPNRYEELIYQTAEPVCKESGLIEIQYIITNLKNNKAPEEDDINLKLFKMAIKIHTYGITIPNQRNMAQ